MPTHKRWHQEMEQINTFVGYFPSAEKVNLLKVHITLNIQNSLYNVSLHDITFIFYIPYFILKDVSHHLHARLVAQLNVGRVKNVVWDVMTTASRYQLITACPNFPAMWVVLT